MRHKSIQVQGSILSSETLAQLESLPGQKSSDFCLPKGRAVRDEISRIYGEAQVCWENFVRRLEALDQNSSATTETRNYWIVPLLKLLGYELEYQPRGVLLNGTNYPISHRAINRGHMPVHIIGRKDKAGLDRKPTYASRKMSGHAMLQEYLNLDEQLYGFVTNGLVFRVLRENTRLVKQSFIEFDLDLIFSEELYADFAALFRLLHATRFSTSVDTISECQFEAYHIDSLESEERIRDGLSDAVKVAITNFGRGMISHPDNDRLRHAIRSGEVSPSSFYQALLRLIYRLLFMFVTEQRGLVYPDEAGETISDTDKLRREVYWKYYSAQRLRVLAERSYFPDGDMHDLWLGLLSSFSLFEDEGIGKCLGLRPLGGDLFSKDALGPISASIVSNGTLLRCLHSLCVYNNPDSDQRIIVNYGGLGVEELGSVYEGLLEYVPDIDLEGLRPDFCLRKGMERASSGSHYTPDKLVKPLLKHVLDPVIAKCRRERCPRDALLRLRIADIACGSGHILLAAARRIASALAEVESGESHPSFSEFKAAFRDVLHNCIFGVDINPLAVELCRVSLWLEAHMPGEPLKFLDDKIRCGNSIVGYVRYEDLLSMGIPNEAFNFHDGDDRDFARAWKKRNSDERKKERGDAPGQGTLGTKDNLAAIQSKREELLTLPEESVEQIEYKRKKFVEYLESEESIILHEMANIPISQFFVEKVQENFDRIMTHAPYMRFCVEEDHRNSFDSSASHELGKTHRYFHWFLEFPEIFSSQGGFDCILGNPPFLGGRRISRVLGSRLCEYIKWNYQAGLSELMVFFLHRTCNLLRPGGYAGLISTNTISQGDIREAGLEKLVRGGISINMAETTMKWPGKANVFVSLVGLYNGEYTGPRYLNKAKVQSINTRLEAGGEGNLPRSISKNRQRFFSGTFVNGDHLYLSLETARDLISVDPRNQDVIFSIINGRDLNSDPRQTPRRAVINFRNRSLSDAQCYRTVFDIADAHADPARKLEHSHKSAWWQLGNWSEAWFEKLASLPYCFCTSRVTKYLNFSKMPTDIVFTDALRVLVTDRWDIFAVLQSNIHEAWARKYSSTLKDCLRYAHSDCFENFPFPANLWEEPICGLATLGEEFHERRFELMLALNAGLTETYNLFHRQAAGSKLGEGAREAMQNFRKISVELDNRVRDAYDWADIDLGHDFHLADNLLEEERNRFTISNSSRQEILSRLLMRNLDVTSE